MAQVECNREEIKLDLAKDWQQVNYLQPIYDDQGGNSTIINLGSGTSIPDRRTIKSVVKFLAKIFAVDLVEARRKYGAIVGRHSSTPILLNTSLILLPLKLRNSFAKGDGAWGYVVLDKIKDWGEVTKKEREAGFKGSISFNDGTRLVAMVNQATIYSLIKDGELVKKKYYELVRPKMSGGDMGQDSSSQIVKNSSQVERVMEAIEEWLKKIN